jgi:hypothetical protein
LPVADLKKVISISVGSAPVPHDPGDEFMEQFGSEKHVASDLIVYGLFVFMLPAWADWLLQ